MKRLRGGKEDDGWGVHHQRTVELAKTYDKTLDLCVESLNQFKWGKVKSIDRSQGMITARTGFNIKTWGEALTFKVQKRGRMHTRVQVSSRPLVWTALVDFGRNLEVVVKVTNFLSDKGSYDRRRGDSVYSSHTFSEKKRKRAPMKDNAEWWVGVFLIFFSIMPFYVAFIHYQSAQLHEQRLDELRDERDELIWIGEDTTEVDASIEDHEPIADKTSRNSTICSAITLLQLVVGTFFIFHSQRNAHK